MTALTANIDRKEKEGKLINHPLAASTIVYAGALVKHNAAGYLAPCLAEAGAIFAGVSIQRVDNSDGAAGDESALVKKEGSFLMSGAGFSQADVGSSVYASDDNTVSTTQAANEQEVGKIVEFISATQVRVKIDNVAV